MILQFAREGRSKVCTWYDKRHSIILLAIRQCVPLFQKRPTKQKVENAPEQKRGSMTR